MTVDFKNCRILLGCTITYLIVWNLRILTLRLGFIQKHILKGIKLSVTKDTDGEGDVSQFGALTTALAATIGTGNIVGVATPWRRWSRGSSLDMVDWCFWYRYQYAESLLSVKYRVKNPDGSILWTNVCFGKRSENEMATIVFSFNGYCSWYREYGSAIHIHTKDGNL